ncbi:hypothetical protein Mal35_20490 [Gimesia maris]|uniref:hypothetical protein n=1 Tax=Gimesia maris TaxID=122 RepID=UPI0011884459|nr:hypothetical protein [Gimesia maris]QDT78600.1 hypothetical protein Mal35_20490 [Gimesia maris]
MTVAYYMNFVEGHHGSKYRIGGLPTLSPEKTPWHPDDNGYFGFISEFDVDGKAIVLPKVKKIQLFQPIDDGDDPTPVVGIIRQPHGNVKQSFQIQVHPLAHARDILLERKVDPDIMPELNTNLEVGPLFKSKLSGVDPWQESSSNRQFIGLLREAESGLNFGGRTCCLYYLRDEDEVIVELK